MELSSFVSGETGCFFNVLTIILIIFYYNCSNVGFYNDFSKKIDFNSLKQARKEVNR